MLINKINIEGICNEEEMKKISLDDVNVFNYNTFFHVDSEYGIKDIIEIAIYTEISNLKFVEFKNTNIAILTLLTNFKIITTENRDKNTLSMIERDIYFNHSFESKGKCGEGINVSVIDCYFKLIDNYKIIATLTYLFKEKEKKINIDEITYNEKSSYRLIDLTEEFA